MSRSTSTLVLPDPAAAATRRGPPRFSTAAFCAFVSVSAMVFPLLFHLLPKFFPAHRPVGSDLTPQVQVAGACICTVAAGIVIAPAVGVGLHLPSGDAVHQPGQEPKYIPLQLFQLVARGQVAGEGSGFTPLHRQEAGFPVCLHGLQHILVQQQ